MASGEGSGRKWTIEEALAAHQKFVANLFGEDSHSIDAIKHASEEAAKAVPGATPESVEVLERLFARPNFGYTQYSYLRAYILSLPIDTTNPNYETPFIEVARLKRKLFKEEPNPIADGDDKNVEDTVKRAHPKLAELKTALKTKVFRSPPPKRPPPNADAAAGTPGKLLKGMEGLSLVDLTEEEEDGLSAGPTRRTPVPAAPTAPTPAHTTLHARSKTGYVAPKMTEASTVAAQEPSSKKKKKTVVTSSSSSSEDEEEEDEATEDEDEEPEAPPAQPQKKKPETTTSTPPVPAAPVQVTLQIFGPLTSGISRTTWRHPSGSFTVSIGDFILPNNEPDTGYVHQVHQIYVVNGKTLFSGSSFARHGGGGGGGGAHLILLLGSRFMMFAESVYPVYVKVKYRLGWNVKAEGRSQYVTGPPRLQDVDDVNVKTFTLLGQVDPYDNGDVPVMERMMEDDDEDGRQKTLVVDPVVDMQYVKLPAGDPILNQVLFPGSRRLWHVTYNH
jgi:hypothetical protein